MKIIVSNKATPAAAARNTPARISDIPPNLIFTLAGRGGFFQRVTFGEPLEKSKLLKDVISRGDYFLMNLTTGSLIYVGCDAKVTAIYELDANAFKIWDRERGFADRNSEDFYLAQKELTANLPIFSGNPFWKP